MLHFSTYSKDKLRLKSIPIPSAVKDRLDQTIFFEIGESVSIFLYHKGDEVDPDEEPRPAKILTAECRGQFDILLRQLIVASAIEIVQASASFALVQDSSLVQPIVTLTYLIEATQNPEAGYIVLSV
jgi:hypothetical protein